MSKADAHHNDSAPPEVEVDDTFDADGALSRAFLQRRGFCCENGCKNCPYGFRKPGAKAKKATSS